MIAELAERLMVELCDPLGVTHRPVAVPAVDEATAWAASGARELTGTPAGPPADVDAVPATVTAAALALAETYLEHDLPGVELLGERAGLLGLTRNAPFSAGGACRCLPGRDGWFALSLAREWDLRVLPALTGAPVGHDPWLAVRRWLQDVNVEDAVTRAIELQLAAAVVPSGRPAERRAPIEVVVGGRRRPTRQPVVVDLSALWAGPLCARLLRLAGARVIKVESVDRPDGTRFGPPAFFRAMHENSEFVRLDFDADRDRLRALIASADVVVEASRPRALRRLGIDRLEYVAAGTVWVSITAYGRSGADADRIGFGDDVAAGAGLVAWTDLGPVPAGDALADPMTGVHAAAAAAIALRGTWGCLLDVSMHDVSRRAAAIGRSV